MKYKCNTPKELLNVGLCLFMEDCGTDGNDYYAQIAIIEDEYGEELTDCVDDCVIHARELEGFEDKYGEAHRLATEYMLSVKDELIERYYKGYMDM